MPLWADVFLLLFMFVQGWICGYNCCVIREMPNAKQRNNRNPAVDAKNVATRVGVSHTWP